MAAPVMGYDAIAVLEEEQHLRVPIIGRQRPAVAEHDGLTFAPVLVEDLNAVFGGDRVQCRASLYCPLWRTPNPPELKRGEDASAVTRVPVSIRPPTISSAVIMEVPPFARSNGRAADAGGSSHPQSSLTDPHTGWAMLLLSSD